MGIRIADGLFGYTDLGVTKQTYACEKCGDIVGFTSLDFEKHRFSKKSNLKGKDKVLADRLILSMIPKYKIQQKMQIFSLTKRDRLIVRVQRFFLRMIGIKESFLPIPKTDENVPDSFIDYNCLDCRTPIRIYYFNYLDGHGSTGMILKYVIN